MLVRIVLWLGPTSQDPSVVIYLLCLGAQRNVAVFTQEEEGDDASSQRCCASVWCDLERRLKCLTALDTCLESSAVTCGHCSMLCWLNK